MGRLVDETGADLKEMEETKMDETITVYEVAEDQSSLLRGIGYNPLSRTLRLKLVTNPDHYYDYEKVPVNFYAGLWEAYSMGTYYNRYIKGKFGHRLTKITEEKSTPLLDQMEILAGYIVRDLFLEAQALLNKY